MNLQDVKTICKCMSYSRFEKSCIVSSFLVCNDQLHFLRLIKDHLPAVEEMTLPAGGFRSIHLQHELRYYPASYKNIEGSDLATVTFGKVPFGKWSESETGEKSLQVRKGTFVCRCLAVQRKLGHESISFSLGFSLLAPAIRLNCLDRLME